MIRGILTVNIDPPYIGFTSHQISLWRESTIEELSALLIDLQVSYSSECLPKELIARLPGEYSRDTLTKLGFHN